jgi:hypothetical protein
MRRLLELETELADFERRTLRAVTAEQKRQIVQLATDFPRLWNASTTAARDRKRMLRLLIKDITIVKAPEPKLLQLCIRWQGGTTETVAVHLPPNRVEAIRYPDTFVDHRTAQARGPHKLNRQALHSRHDTLDPLQASHSRSAASRQNIQRQSGSREIRRQPVGGLLLDRPRSRNSAQKEARLAIRHRAHRRDRSQTAGLGCQLAPHRPTSPNPS